MASIPICCIVGARPNFMKMAAILRELPHHPRFTPQFIHTGQHFSPEMSQAFFHDLELPEPDSNLGVGGGSHTVQTAEIMCRLEKVFEASRPGLVLVVGDVNSTVAAALVASKMGIPVAHVEAGLRSFDRTMPEEINRLVTDVLSSFLFASEPSGVENLLAEGIVRDKISLVGNVMIDTLLRFRQKAAASDVLSRIGLSERSYAVLTLHRPSNVDDPAMLRRWLAALDRLAAEIPVVFPIHPRTRQRMEALGIRDSRVRMLPPLNYLDFMQLMAEARLVLTDSGGIQEETTILQVPCLTLRDNTERPVTIAEGTNRLAGACPERAIETALASLDGVAHPGRIPEYWDGHAAERILAVLEEKF